MASPTPVHQSLVAMLHHRIFVSFVTTFSHLCTPSVFILYKCMVLHLSCLSSQFAYFVIAISHLFTYPNTPTVFPHLCLSACVLPSFPSLPLSYIPPFPFFFTYWSFIVLLGTNSVSTMRVDNWKPAFWLKPVWCISSFKVFEVACTSFGNEREKELPRSAA